MNASYTDNHEGTLSSDFYANPWPRGTLAVLLNELCSGPQGSLYDQLHKVVQNLKADFRFY